MFQEITVTDLLKKQKKNEVVSVDVRSPQEFLEFHIPGSINIPLFTDEEREIVGTIYTKESPEAAKQKGLALFSTKLPAFIAQFKLLEKEPVVYCWRGGMRSKTAATVVDLMDINVSRLQGGIRSYRKWTVAQIEEESFSKKLFVLNGYTGSGKTTLLHQLQDLGYPIIDIEKMANHRGSVFGEIGLSSHNQKTFDSLLVQTLKKHSKVPFFLVEGESRRIGKVTLPERLYQKKEASPQLFIYLPLEKRVENILKDYQPEKHPKEILLAFQRIKKHIHTPIAKKIDVSLKNENYQQAVSLLLIYYYDPLYEEKLGNYKPEQRVPIYAKNLEEALEKIIDYLKEV